MVSLGQTLEIIPAVQTLETNPTVTVHIVANNVLELVGRDSPMSHSCAEFPLTTCTAQEGCGTSLTLVYYPVFICISRDIVGVVGGFCV